MKFHSTVLFVKSIKKSKDFYTRVLGFKVDYDFGNNLGFEGGISLWEIMPHHEIDKKLTTFDNSNRFELYFESEEINDVYNELKKEGVTFFQELVEESWGQRTMRFFDPDRHLIEVGEPLNVFIRRLFQKELSIVEIETKTGVSAEKIHKILAS